MEYLSTKRNLIKINRIAIYELDETEVRFSRFYLI